MSAFNEQTIRQSHQKRTQEQELQEMYGYFIRQSPEKIQKQQEANEQSFQSQQNIYEGCEYCSESYYEDAIQFQQYEYKGSEKKQKRTHLHTASQGVQNSFASKYQQERQCNSQPNSIDRWQNSNSISNKNFSSNSSKQPINSRSVIALVSTQKKKKKVKKAPSKAISQKSSSISSVSTRNKFIQEHKQKKKNGDHSVEPIFFNPLDSLPFQAMDVEGFQKFYKSSHSQMFQKINTLQKKIAILGEKAFFKDKQNEKIIDEIFKSMGLKTSIKMGKAKSFREFRAIHKYINMDNPEGSGRKQRKFGDGAVLIENTYLSQFKQLMGFKQEENTQSSKKSLLGYGFGKLQRKH